MKNLMSFESFSSHVKAQSQSKVNEEKTGAQKASAAAYENLLKKFDVTSPAELQESAKESFIKELFSANKANEAKINEADIKSDEDFREYVNTILKQQHPDDFDADKAKEVADGLLAKKKGNDYGALIGMLNKS
jgi:hypothetical protein